MPGAAATLLLVSKLPLSAVLPAAARRRPRRTRTAVSTIASTSTTAPATPAATRTQPRSGSPCTDDGVPESSRVELPVELLAGNELLAGDELLAGNELSDLGCEPVGGLVAAFVCPGALEGGDSLVVDGPGLLFDDVVDGLDSTGPPGDGAENGFVDTTDIVDTLSACVTGWSTIFGVDVTPSGWVVPADKLPMETIGHWQTPPRHVHGVLMLLVFFWHSSPLPTCWNLHVKLSQSAVQQPEDGMGVVGWHWEQPPCARDGHSNKNRKQNIFDLFVRLSILALQRRVDGANTR